MRRVRIIARLDIKAPNLIKGVQLEGLRKLGDPNAFARRYYEQGVDEIIYMDIVASLYQRNSLLDIVSGACHDVYVPLTVGGGIRSLEDARAALRAGADKVAMNTAAVANPSDPSDRSDRSDRASAGSAAAPRPDGAALDRPRSSRPRSSRGSVGAPRSGLIAAVCHARARR